MSQPQSGNSPAPDLEEQRQFYDEHWQAHGEWRGSHELLRLGTILATAAPLVEGRPRGSMRVLDLGCGTGWLAAELRLLGSVTGFDLSAKAIEIGRRRHPDLDLHSGDLFEIPGAGEYDLVVSSEVIEHVEDQREFLELCNRLLVPSGHLILTCPNGRVQDWVDVPSPQPLENWPRPRHLARLARERFRILEHRTFLPPPLRRGPFARIASSRMRTKLLGMGLGLYQLLFAQKRD